MVNYGNGKIYKIVSNQTDKVYVGSTTKKYLSQRIDEHRSRFRAWKRNTYHYVTSFDIIQYDDAEIILIENAECKSKDELHARERHWIDQLDCVNKNIPGRGRKEYIKEYCKKNREKLCQTKKRYYTENNEKIKKKSNRYYENNKNNILQRLQKKDSCICGIVVSHGHRSRHNKSVKHKQWIQQELEWLSEQKRQLEEDSKLLEHDKHLFD